MKNRLKYVQIEEALFDEDNGQSVRKAASTAKAAMKLIELGFQYVCDFDKVKQFRKRM
ncbi:MAG: hypothetical protein QGG23_05725 [Candidatus Bathyarchaeota archaeon]|nr:hypothetical protein [Candidatus Bathyarchaeota archaeon]MDP7207400.1 hypothetical protein [Candidatus Bathyarchaeota archaeon]